MTDFNANFFSVQLVPDFPLRNIQKVDQNKITRTCKEFDRKRKGDKSLIPTESDALLAIEIISLICKCHDLDIPKRFIKKLESVIAFFVPRKRISECYFGGYYYRILKRDKSRFIFPFYERPTKGILLSAVNLVDNENWRIVAIALQNFIRYEYLNEKYFRKICRFGPCCKDGLCKFIHA